MTSQVTLSREIKMVIASQRCYSLNAFGDVAFIRSVKHTYQTYLQRGSSRLMHTNKQRNEKEDGGKAIKSLI